VIQSKNVDEHGYLNLLQQILEEGVPCQDRTGVGTLSLFGTRLSFNLQNGFPLLTTKKMFWKGVVEELLWFIRGETDSKKLEAKGVNIWKGNTSKEFLDKRKLPYSEGEIGPMYGAQWRNWGGTYPKLGNKDGIDQLANVIESIKKDPNGRRHVVSAWNVGDLDKGVLPPCHILFQFRVNPKAQTLDCQLYQRSCDYFLGVPFNIASYSLLLELIARVTGYKAGNFIWVGGDTHIYNNHIEQARQQITRAPYPFPQLSFSRAFSSLAEIEELRFEDIVIKDYKAWPAIKGDMAV
jgi:thymidylate synthase